MFSSKSQFPFIGLKKQKQHTSAVQMTSSTTTTAAINDESNDIMIADINYENDNDVATRSLLYHDYLLHGSRGGGDTAIDHKYDGGTSSLSTSIFNLVNNVAGAGMLTLSSGMAKGDSTGYIPAILICMLFGTISGHTFNLIGKSCELTGANDFKGLWSYNIGKSSTYVVDSIIALQCFASCVIYSGILGDLSTKLLAAYNIVPNKYNNRSWNVLLISTTTLFPLGLIKNLSALGFTSILGLISVLYTVIFIVTRSLDGSYDLSSGQFINNENIIQLSESLKPSFQKTSLFNFGLSALVLASSFSLSFFAHYNSPVYHRELKHNTSQRFSTMVKYSYFILFMIYTVVMISGYSTFGDNCQGNILLNYHPNDILSNFGQIATFFSIVFGFPLVLRGLRESATGVLNAFGIMNTKQSTLVFILLSLITAVSVNVNDVSLVVGLSGATCGCFLVFICPVILFVKSMGNVYGLDSLDYMNARKNLLIIPFGFCVGLLGVIMTLKNAGIL